MRSRYPTKSHPLPSEGISRRSREELIHGLRKLGKPVVEIGGPTSSGFDAIKRRKLPGILITNIGMEPGVEALVDARQLPFADSSLGGILTAGLTQIPEEIANKPKPKGYSMAHLLVDKDLAKNDENLFLMMAAAQDLNELGTSEFTDALIDPERYAYSQRAALIKEARRTLATGGFLIWNTITTHELNFALELGFQGVNNFEDQRDHGLYHGELILRLVDKHTVAGEFIDANESVIGTQT